MKLVIIESPFRGETPELSSRNLRYLGQCLRNSILRGELPFASHAIYPQALDDSQPRERQIGIELGYEMWRFADSIAFYIDFGWSPGMLAAKEKADSLAHLKKEIRRLMDD